MARDHHHSLTYATKRLIRKQHRETGSSLSELASWYETRYKQPISRSTLSGVLSDRNAFLDEGNELPKRIRNRRPKWEKLDEMLFAWQLEEEACNRPTKTPFMIKAAKEIWEKLPEEYKTDPITKKPLSPPKFSSGWLTGYNQRHNQKRIEINGGANAVPEAVHSRMEEIRLSAQKYPQNCIYHMDESALCFNRGPSVGVAAEALAGSKVEEPHITITFCVNSDGSDKLPLHFIGSAAEPRGFAAQNSHYWVYRNNPTACMTTELMCEWLQLFYKHVGQKKVLLLMDDYSAHKCALEKGSPPDNISLMFLPVHSKNVYQPLNQGIIDCVKRRYTNCLLKEQLRYYRTSKVVQRLGLAPALSEVNITLDEAISWTDSIWHDEISNATIKQSFSRSTLFDEGLAAKDFEPSEIPLDTIKLYDSVVAMGEISNPVAIEKFLNPEQEDDLSNEANPTIVDLVKIHAPVSEIGKEEGVVEKLPTTWKEAVRMADVLLSMMHHSGQNTPELKSSLRKVIRICSKMEINSAKQSSLGFVEGGKGSTASSMKTMNPNKKRKISKGNDFGLCTDLSECSEFSSLEKSSECERKNETIPECEPQCETKPECGTNPDTIHETEPETEHEPECGTKPETEPETIHEREPECEPECEPKPETETETKHETEHETKPETKHETEHENEHEHEHEHEHESKIKSKSEHKEQGEEV